MTMRYRMFGPDKLPMSVIGIGTWVTGGDNWGPVDDNKSVRAIHEALEHGINLIDTAPSYGEGHAETVVGKAIRGRRDGLVIATKCGLRKKGKKHSVTLRPADIRDDLEGSLRRLGIETVDLYQCHWPDAHTPLEETMEALLRLRQEGKINYIGVSNFDQTLLEKCLASAPVVSLQTQYSLLAQHQAKNVILFCCDHNIGVVAYGSLGGGILSGKYPMPPNLRKGDARSFFYRFYRDPQWTRVVAVVSELIRIAGKRGKHPAQAALNWVVQQPGITCALVGMRTPEQACLNAGAGEWELSAEDLKELERAAERVSPEMASSAGSLD